MDRGRSTGRVFRSAQWPVKRAPAKCNTNEMSEIQESVDKVADWPAMNCMKINSKKSKEMIISFTHDVNFKKSVPNITIEGIPVEVVKHAKLLGVILSDDLTWNMHVDSIVKKSCQKGIYVVSAEESRYKTN